MEVKFKPQTLCNPRKACGRAPHLFLSTLSSDCSCAEWPNFYITFILHLYNTFILRSMEIYFQCVQRKGTSSAQQREPAWKIWRLTRRGWYVKDCSIHYQTCHPFPKPPLEHTGLSGSNKFRSHPNARSGMPPPTPPLNLGLVGGINLPVVHSWLLQLLPRAVHASLNLPAILCLCQH